MRKQLWSTGAIKYTETCECRSPISIFLDPDVEVCVVVECPICNHGMIFDIKKQDSDLCRCGHERKDHTHHHQMHTICKICFCSEFREEIEK